MTIKIHLEGRHLEASVQPGETVHKALVSTGIAIDAPCGGRGACRKCLVAIDGQEGLMLSCQTIAQDGMVVRVPSEGEANIQAEGELADVPLRPAVTVAVPDIAPATLEHPSDTFSRLSDAIAGLLPPAPEALCALNDMEEKGSAAVLFDGVLPLDFLTKEKSKALYGAAVDIGTTTVVAYIVDLLTGKTIAHTSALNAQRAFGADVIARAEHAAEPQGLTRLRDAIRGQIEEMITSALQSAGLAGPVYHIAIAGNTIMMHLLLGIPPQSITKAPFAPVIAMGMDIPSGELFPEYAGGMTTLLPCVAGYVGADTIAALLAIGTPPPDAPTLLVDIGTNGEMALLHQNRICACSAAAGPAFEGAHIACGLGGVKGAIDSVWRQSDVDNALGFSTIGNTQPRGICGSGIVDAIATLLEIGALEETGRFGDEEDFTCLASREGGVIVPFTDTVYLTQKDIREVQLAKGAIAAGIDILLAREGLSPGDIRHTLLAGGFGSHISPQSACRIGILPKQLQGSIRAIGNAAGAGARAALLDRSARQRAEELRQRTEYIELSARPDFQERFVEHMMFE